MVSFLELVLGGIRVMLLIRAMGCQFESLEYAEQGKTDIIAYVMNDVSFQLNRSLYFSFSTTAVDVMRLPRFLSCLDINKRTR